MNKKSVVALAIAAVFSSAAIAEEITSVNKNHPLSPQAMDVVPVHKTADMLRGPYTELLPNPVSPGDLDTPEARAERAQHLASVNQDRIQLGMSTIPNPYGSADTTAIGGTRSPQAGGRGVFPQRPID
ncbi:MAG: hypothetical protein ACXWUK_01010 [Burkholderiales bacterium]